ncbi:hypothetical protein K503DRAFT_807056 [Rhizopogon vinicolor AM-OR11-026]|uniref:Uncharacterized protein n=1 Tax=Rhizopogon vinicolor AM-OR11-026 TaxID=1314800 RepID=A0A1B7MD89_9AGAM|nr:hypothetical protein K503DRAFT_807056 [Rhizopogon vinicolor AM-OR11-026]
MQSLAAVIFNVMQSYLLLLIHFIPALVLRYPKFMPHLAAHAVRLIAVVLLTQSRPALIIPSTPSFLIMPHTYILDHASFEGLCWKYELVLKIEPFTHRHLTQFLPFFTRRELEGGVREERREKRSQTGKNAKIGGEKEES